MTVSGGAQVAREEAGRWLESLFGTREKAIVALAGFMFTLGLFFRIKNFGYPDSFQFDEHHFVENARNYLAGRADLNDHPPLGKLLIAAAIAALGDNAVSWRLPALLFGFLSIALSWLAASRLFRSRLAGLGAAAFASIDGFMVAYSRAALLDGTLCAMGLLALVAATLETGWLVGVGILAAGVAMSVKFSGIAALVAPTLALFLRPMQPRARMLALAALFGGAVALYIAFYCLGFLLAKHPLGIGEVVEDTRRLLAHHAALTDMKNGATSSWPTWVVPTKPILLGFVREEGSVQALSSLGNLALWWSAWAVTLSCCATILWQGVARTLAPRREVDAREGVALPFLDHDGRGAVLALAGALAFGAPWVLSHRDSYIYHFLPSYALMLVLLAGFVRRHAERMASTVVAFFATVTLVAGFYGPVWCYLPLSEAAFSARLFVPSWR